MPVSLQTLKLTPAMKSLRTKVGVAVDGNIREGDLNLASSTLLQDENSKDIFGMVISYTVKVKLFLGQCDLTFRKQPTEQIFAKKLMQSNTNTVFPQIVSSLEQIPPFLQPGAMIIQVFITFLRKGAVHKQCRLKSSKF